MPTKLRLLAGPISVLASVLAPIAAGCTGEPEPMLVTIQTGEPPALLAFRDQASSKWQAMATAGASTTDQQWAEISASTRQFSSGGITRARMRSTVARDVRPGEPATVTLPESLGQVTFQMTADRLVAEWSSLPEYEQLWLGSFSIREDLQLEHSFWPSPAFIEATGATSATLDLRDVPGFKSAWLPDPADDWYRALSAERYTSVGDSVVSSVSESATPMSAARASRDPRRHPASSSPATVTTTNSSCRWALAPTHSPGARATRRAR